MRKHVRVRNSKGTPIKSVKHKVTAEDITNNIYDTKLINQQMAYIVDEYGDFEGLLNEYNFEVDATHEKLGDTRGAVHNLDLSDYYDIESLMEAINQLTNEIVKDYNKLEDHDYKKTVFADNNNNSLD